MGAVFHGAGHAVSSAVKGTVNAVTAPVHVVTNIASGKNVFESIGQGVAQTVAAGNGFTAGLATSTGLTKVLPKIPVIGALGGVLAQQLETTDAINQSNTVTRGQGITLARTGAELGAAVAGGEAAGAAISAGDLTVGQLITTGLVGAGALSKGNAAGVLDAAGSLAGDSSLGDAFTTAGEVVNGLNPPSAPPRAGSGVLVLPQSVSGVTGGGFYQGSSTDSILPLAAVSVGGIIILYLFKKGLKHG